MKYEQVTGAYIGHMKKLCHLIFIQTMVAHCYDVTDTAENT